MTHDFDTEKYAKLIQGFSDGEIRLQTRGRPLASATVVTWLYHTLEPELTITELAEEMDCNYHTVAMRIVRARAFFIRECKK